MLNALILRTLKPVNCKVPVIYESFHLTEALLAQVTQEIPLETKNSKSPKKTKQALKEIQTMTNPKKFVPLIFSLCLLLTKLEPILVFTQLYAYIYNSFSFSLHADPYPYFICESRTFARWN